MKTTYSKSWLWHDMDRTSHVVKECSLFGSTFVDIVIVKYKLDIAILNGDDTTKVAQLA